MQPTITVPELSSLDTVVDLWVALAREQRQFGSHLLVDENRAIIQESFARRIVNDDLLVATIGDDVVGFVSYRVEQRLFQTDRERGFVQNLYVRPEYRGEGIGTRLLTAAEARLWERGCETVALESLSANEPARAFYNDRGYVPQRIEFEKSMTDDGIEKFETDNPNE